MGARPSFFSFVTGRGVAPLPAWGFCYLGFALGAANIRIYNPFLQTAVYSALKMLIFTAGGLQIRLNGELRKHRNRSLIICCTIVISIRIPGINSYSNKLDNCIFKNRV